MSNAAVKNQKTFSVKKLVVCAMLSAIAFVLMYLEIVVPLMPSFIKFDFSDLPVIIGSFILGPVWGVVICLIKNVLHLAVSQSMFIGELSNFMLGAVFALAAGFVYRKKPSFKRAVTGGVIGAAAMGAFSVISNYFIVYPVYYTLMPKDVIINAYDAIASGILHIGNITEIWQCLVFFNLPFTILKGLCDVVIVIILYRPLMAVARRL